MAAGKRAAGRRLPHRIRRRAPRRPGASGRSRPCRRRHPGGGAVRRFAQLFSELDASTATTAKVQALRRYFAQVDDADAAWAVYFLSGGKPRQVVPTSVLRALACVRAGIDEWLFEECYQAVGDLAETIAHVLPPATSPSDVGLAHWVEERLLPLRTLTPEEQAHRIATYWDELNPSGRF